MNSFLALCYIPSLLIGLMQVLFTIYGTTSVNETEHERKPSKRAWSQKKGTLSAFFELDFVSDLSLRRADHYLTTDVVLLSSWFWSTYLMRDFDWMCIFLHHPPSRSCPWTTTNYLSDLVFAATIETSRSRATTRTNHNQQTEFTTASRSVYCCS